MSIKSDLNAISKFIESREIGLQSIIHSNDEYDEEVQQLIRLCHIGFPKFDSSIWNKCLRSVELLLEDQLASLAHLHLEGFESDGIGDAICDVVCELVDDQGFTDVATHNGLERALESYLPLYQETLDSDLVDWGFAYSKSNNGYQFRLVDKNAYIDKLIAKKSEGDLEDLVDYFLIESRPSRGFLVLNWVGYNTDSKLNKFSLGNAQFLLLIMLHNLCKFRSEASKEHLIRAQSLGIEFMSLQRDEVKDINYAQVKVDSKYSNQSSIGGKNRAARYDRSLIKVKELLRRDYKNYSDNTEAAKFIGRALETWREGLEDAGEDISEIDIFSEGHLRKTVIPKLIEELGL